MKSWIITAELNMDASHYETIIIKANTKEKALKLAEEKFKKLGAFSIMIISIKKNT